MAEKEVKRKVGRPKKKPLEMPVFKNDREIRKFLFATGLEVMMKMKETAMNGNNIKKPEIARAKNSQFKIVLESIKVLDGVLKNMQLDNIEERIELLESVNAEVLSDDPNAEKKLGVSDNLFEIQKINEELLKFNEGLKERKKLRDESYEN